MSPDALQTLIERRNYLAQRIKAKRFVGWDTAYDQREYNALREAINELGRGQVEDDGA